MRLLTPGLFRLFGVLILLGSPLWATIKVGTLNCFFLVDPARTPEGQLSEKAPAPEVYVTKLENLSGMVRGLDVVGIQEVGSELEAKALAKRAGYQARFVQGKDTFTGQDVATLVAERPGLVFRGATRVRELEILSKHLLVTLEEGGTRYAILNVHLIRPIGQNQEKHERQLAAMRDWSAALKQRAPETVVVVLGDFNNTTPSLLPLADSSALTDNAPTHLDKRAFDRIFSSGALDDVVVVRPPYPKRPNDLLKAMWSDHYLLKATVGR